MIATFKKGTFNNYYVDRAIRKNDLTLRFFKESIKEILNRGWSLQDEGIWVDTPQETKHFNDIEEAVAFLKNAGKGAIFVTMTKNNKKAYIRWYDSDPQTDVLSVEGIFTYRDNKIVAHTKLEDLNEIIEVISSILLSKISADDVKDLSEEYRKTMETDWIYLFLGEGSK